MWKIRHLSPSFHGGFVFVLYTVVYFKVNVLSEWIIGIYLHEFTNNALPSSILTETSGPLLVNEYW